MEPIKGRFFTCIGRQGHGAPATPATREDWEQLRREPWLKQMCERIKRGDEALKKRLPWWTPHCAEYKDNHRSIADAVRPLRRLMMDFDDKGHTDEIMRSLTPSPSPIGEESEMTAGALVVLLVEESVRRGTHVLVELPESITPEEAQELMKEATGFTPDKVVKGVDRCIYMVPEDHTRYVNPRLFEIPKEPIEATPVAPAIAPPSPVQQVAIEETASEDNKNGNDELCFKGIPYTSIIREWWLRTGGEPAEGERNVKLHKLAVNLRAICDNKREVLMAVMPRFGLSEGELKSIVDSACKEEPKGVSKVMQSIVSALEASPDLSEGSEGGEGDAADVGFEHPLLQTTLYTHLAPLQTQ